MKSTFVQEISIKELHTVGKDEEDSKKLSGAPAHNQQSLSERDYPKNIENYFVLLKALYENSSLVNRIKSIQEQSCERKLESFKENIIAIEVDNNRNSNQQQHVTKKNININIKNESDISAREACKTVGSERSLGNIIINSLDVSINVAAKTNSTDCSYGNDEHLAVSCSTSPKTNLPLVSCDSLEQLVTSSSSEPSDEQTILDEKPITSSSEKSENNNLASNNINDGPTARAVNSTGVKMSQMVPDDISFDYHDIKCSGNVDDDDKHTTSTTCNNNPTKYSSGEDDDVDYHTKTITEHCNKRNNSAGDIKPITSTYLLMTRSMGLTDEDALNLVSDALP
jgi:hypothetical protein